MRILLPGPHLQRLTKRSVGFRAPDSLSAAARGVRGSQIAKTAAAKGVRRKRDRENSGCEGGPGFPGPTPQRLRRGCRSFRKGPTAAAGVFRKFRKGPTAAAKGVRDFRDPPDSGCAGGVESPGPPPTVAAKGVRDFRDPPDSGCGVGSGISGTRPQRLSGLSKSSGKVPQWLRDQGLDAALPPLARGNEFPRYPRPSLRDENRAKRLFVRRTDEGSPGIYSRVAASLQAQALTAS
jgi:hypothetical protein